MLDSRLLKGIVAYALSDYLRYKLGKRLIGIEDIDEEFEMFADAVRYLAERPKVRQILSTLNEKQMSQLLETLEDQIL